MSGGIQSGPPPELECPASPDPANDPPLRPSAHLQERPVRTDGDLSAYRWWEPDLLGGPEQVTGEPFALHKQHQASLVTHSGRPDGSMSGWSLPHRQWTCPADRGQEIAGRIRAPDLTESTGFAKQSRHHPTAGDRRREAVRKRTDVEEDEDDRRYPGQPCLVSGLGR